MALGLLGYVLGSFASPVAVNRILAYVIFCPTTSLCLIYDQQIFGEV